MTVGHIKTQDRNWHTFHGRYPSLSPHEPAFVTVIAAIIRPFGPWSDGHDLFSQADVQVYYYVPLIQYCFVSQDSLRRSGRLCTFQTQDHDGQGNTNENVSDPAVQPSAYSAGPIDFTET